MTYKANMELEKRLAKENRKLCQRHQILTPVLCTDVPGSVRLRKEETM